MCLCLLFWIESHELELELDSDLNSKFNKKEEYLFKIGWKLKNVNGFLKSNGNRCDSKIGLIFTSRLIMRDLVGCWLFLVRLLMRYYFGSVNREWDMFISSPRKKAIQCLCSMMGNIMRPLCLKILIKIQTNKRRTKQFVFQCDFFLTTREYFCNESCLGSFLESLAFLPRQNCSENRKYLEIRKKIPFFLR